MGPEKVRFQPARQVMGPKAGDLQVALQALVRGWYQTQRRPDASVGFAPQGARPTVVWLLGENGMDGPRGNGSLWSRVTRRFRYMAGHSTAGKLEGRTETTGAGVNREAERSRAGPRNRPPGRRGSRGARREGPSLRAATPATPPPAGDLHLRSPPAAHTPGPVITPGAHSLTAASDAAGPLPPPSRHPPPRTPPADLTLIPSAGLSHVDQRLPAPAPGLQTAQGIVTAVLVPGPSTALPRCPSVLLIRPDSSEGSAPAPVFSAPTEDIPHKDVRCPRGHVLRELPPADGSASRFTKDREELGMRQPLLPAYPGTWRWVPSSPTPAPMETRSAPTAPLRLPPAPPPRRADFRSAPPPRRADFRPAPPPRRRDFLPAGLPPAPPPLAAPSRPPA
ncbi:uncharacterized protein LOC129536158 [Moschus berezovskii]|uniref:uncharacterized protein LOC129536158 n=1 Tax=Moschus berezovskii TaxID=68408 RepID=UPI002444BE9A|nr:uncharacterized protein LOC129536158 [Moschus berezovskii]